MKRNLLTLTIAVVMMLAGGACFSVPIAPEPTKGGLIPPPVINIPYGGVVVTEVNISDDDVLGIIKQILPVASGVVQSAIPQALSEESADMPLGLSSDVGMLSEAIDGIKNIRFIIAKYDRAIDPTDMIEQFGNGVAKIGRFSKVASDFAFVPGVFGLYAQENNSGYMGFLYDYDGKVLYAARIVGSVDISKLVDLASKHIGSRQPATFPQAEQEPDASECGEPSGETEATCEDDGNAN